MPEERKDGRSRVTRAFVSALRPEIRGKMEQGAEALEGRISAGNPIRSGISERIFSLVINEAERWAERRGGMTGALVETLASDSADIFGATFFKRKKDEATTLFQKWVKKEGEVFLDQAAQRLRTAKDKAAERERLKVDFEENLENTRFLKELTELMQPPKPPREPIELGTKVSHAAEVATRPLDQWSDRLEQRAQRKGRKI